MPEHVEHIVAVPPKSMITEMNLRRALNETMKAFIEMHQLPAHYDLALILRLPDVRESISFPFKNILYFMYEYELDVHKAFRYYIVPMLNEHNTTLVAFHWYYSEGSKEPVDTPYRMNSRKRNQFDDDEADEAYSNKRMCVRE